MTTRLLVWLACTAVAVGLAGCGSSPKAPERESGREHDVRAVAQAYLDAFRRGDGLAACRLLSPTGLRDGGTTLKQCARDASDLRQLGTVPIVSVVMNSPTTATVTVGDAKYSDSGNDAMELRRYGSRWLIDGG
jgi:hypothetical protein